MEIAVKLNRFDIFVGYALNLWTQPSVKIPAFLVAIFLGSTDAVDIYPDLGIAIASAVLLIVAALAYFPLVAIGVVTGSLLPALLLATKPGILGTHRFRTGSEGLIHSTSASTNAFAWRSILIVKQSRIGVLLCLAGEKSYFIPRRAFENSARRSEFANKLNASSKCKVGRGSIGSGNISLSFATEIVGSPDNNTFRESSSVEVQLNRLDVFLGAAFNNMTLWIMWLLPILCGILIGLNEAQEVFDSSAASHALLVFVMVLLQYSIGLTVLGTILTAGILAMTPGDMPGILGHHCYDLRSQGLIEKTDVNVQTIGWNGVRSVRSSVLGAHLRLADTSVHFLPRRAFNGNQHLDSFVMTANEFRIAAKRV
jgi:hypothetical protein